ncbi:MAG TPA: ribonuclease Y [Actinomycetota bacterium]|jgi:ribonuclease Y|nr:ribonuclease Y [Actinomycetota bacterium]
MEIIILGLVLGLGIGGAVGFFVRKRLSEAQLGTAELRGREMLEQARDKARQQAEELRNQAERETNKLRSELGRLEKAVESREAAVESRSDALDGRERKLEAREQKVLERERHVDSLREEAAAQVEEARKTVERVAGMTQQDARDQLLASIEDEAKRDALALVRDFEAKAREEAERRARKIVVTAIQRLGAEQAQESSTSVVQLPNEDMKGRIIGREGRNIRHFEQVTGVNLIVDDTPEAILLSCFDPVRREVARITIDSLISDGRIHPARIEEQYEKARSQVEQEIRSSGEEAINELGITNVNPELVRALGRLRFRYSYGQNVLRHSVEASHLAAMIAAELGSDPQLAKRCTLFHDIGKAVAQEVEGTHAHVGAELARRLGEPPAVVHAIEAHHGEVEMRTIEAVITQAADAISGSRPGARRESFEAYVKRLERLEEIAKSFKGVEKVYAMQAGREIRVMVEPGAVDDVAAQVMAREIAKRVEEELQYPGQIKVVVLRELRSVEYAR